MVHTDSINPTAFRTAKTLWSFDRSECNRVKAKLSMQPHKDPYHSPTYLNIPDNMGFYCSTPDNQTGSMYSVKNIPQIKLHGMEVTMCNTAVYVSGLTAVKCLQRRARLSLYTAYFQMSQFLCLSLDRCQNLIISAKYMGQTKLHGTNKHTNMEFCGRKV